MSARVCRKRLSLCDSLFKLIFSKGTALPAVGLMLRKEKAVQRIFQQQGSKYIQNGVLLEEHGGSTDRNAEENKAPPSCRTVSEQP